jgi:uncharacterized membrane protein YqjE
MAVKLLRWPPEIAMANLPPTTTRNGAGSDTEGLVAHLGQLLRLEIELGLSETRGVLITAAIAIAVAVVAGTTLIASAVVLVAAAFAPLFDARWEPLLIAGGGTAVLAVLALGWSAWRLRRLQWPRETLISFRENWRWLAAQVRSSLTLR